MLWCVIRLRNSLSIYDELIRPQLGGLSKIWLKKGEGLVVQIKHTFNIVF